MEDVVTGIKQKMKPSIVLMGSKPGSVAALNILKRRGWDILGVVVSAREPHPWLSSQKLQDAASAEGIPVYTQAELPRQLRPDFIVSYMYRNRVKSDVLAMAQRAALNFHAGPLPEYGGWAFYNIAILENAQEYGCTCHHMDEGFDTGSLCFVRRFKINPHQHTASSLERRAQLEMINLFVEFVTKAERGEALPQEPQLPERMRYMSFEEFTSLKRIPDNASAELIDRYARAFWYPPYPGAYIERDGCTIEVVPELARKHVAPFLHSDELSALEAISLLAEDQFGAAGT